MPNPHQCTGCDEQFADIIAYESHDCPAATICGYCFGPLDIGTHNGKGCSATAAYIEATHQDGWCDASVTVHDGARTYGARVFPVGCIQRLDHNGPHTWTTYRPESTWTDETRISLPMDSDAN